MEVQVRRVSIISHKPFEEIVQMLMSTIGHPDMNVFQKALAEAITVSDLGKVVYAAIGSSDLMEFARFDAGEVLHKEQRGQGQRSSGSSSGIHLS